MGPNLPACTPFHNPARLHAQTGFVTIFLAPAWGARGRATLPAPLVWVVRFILFKLMLMSGAARSRSAPPPSAPPLVIFLATFFRTFRS